MSWSRRRLLAVGLGLLAGPGLGACGFRPLYGRTNAAPGADQASVTAHLAAIDIETPRWNRSPSPYDAAEEAVFDARTAQVLHNALRDGFNPYGQPGASAYVLVTKLSEAIGGLLSVDINATVREEVALTAEFELMDAKTKSLLNGSVQASVSYLVEPQQPYNTIVARNDARQRAARQLAEFMKLRLSAFFAGQS